MTTVTPLHRLKTFVRVIPVVVTQKWRWAMQKKLFWWNCLFAVCTAGVPYFWPAPDQSDFRIRTLGMIFQIIGVATVWFDLTATARSFGKQGYLRATWDWIRAGLFGRNIVVCLSGNAMATSGGRARIKQRQTIASNVRQLQRIEALENFVVQVDRDLDDAVNEIYRSETELLAIIKSETAERKVAVGEVDTRLKEASTGNTSLLSFGVVWLGVGVVLATWSPEIAKIVGGHWSAVVKTI